MTSLERLHEITQNSTRYYYVGKFVEDGFFSEMSYYKMPSDEEKRQPLSKDVPVLMMRHYPKTITPGRLRSDDKILVKLPEESDDEWVEVPPQEETSH